VVEQSLSPQDAWHVPGRFACGTLDDLQLVRMARMVACRQALTALVQDPHGAHLYDAGSEAFRIATRIRILTELAEQVLREGATPVVVVLARERDVMQNRSGFKLHLPLLWYLSAADIPTIDVTDRLTRETNGRGIDRLFEFGQYSALGNTVVARYLAGVLPPYISGTCRG